MTKKITMEEMPAFLTSKDLVALGVFKTKDCSYHARRNKCSPPYIKLNHKILYPKQGLIEWLEERTVSDK
jgi:hypothetical protein